MESRAYTRPYYCGNAMTLPLTTPSRWWRLQYRAASSTVDQWRSLFFVAILYGLLALATAALLFPGAVGIVSVFLHSLSLMTAFEFVLEKNGNDIWQRHIDPVRANLHMTISLLALFLGGLCVYFFAAIMMSSVLAEHLFAAQLEGAVVQITQIRFANFAPTLAHNLLALCTFLLFALLYRTGAVFAVLWNASVWGAVFGVTTHHAPGVGSAALLNGAKILLCTMPHLVSEALAYILAAMAGMFLSKALSKYRWSDDKFYRVLRACTVILLLAIGTLLLAALLESHAAPWLVQRLFAGMPIS